MMDRGYLYEPEGKKKCNFSGKNGLFPSIHISLHQIRLILYIGNTEGSLGRVSSRNVLRVLVLLKNHLFSFVSLHFQSSQHSGSSTSLASTKVCSSMDENDGPAEGNIWRLTFQSSQCSDNSSCVGNESFFLPEKVGALRAGCLSVRRLISLSKMVRFTPDQIWSGHPYSEVFLLQGTRDISSAGDTVLTRLFHSLFVSSVMVLKNILQSWVFPQKWLISSHTKALSKLAKGWCQLQYCQFTHTYT